MALERDLRLALLFIHLDKIIFMKEFQLGEFEELVLLTIGILNNVAYSIAVKDEMEDRLNRPVSLGALHTALKRMEGKGYLKSYFGEAKEERAGRPRKYFEITATGKKALLFSKETRDTLWNAIPASNWQSSLKGI